MDKIEVEIGDMVIVNDVDRPNGRHVAIITRAYNGVADCRYLHEELDAYSMRFDSTQPTLLSDFARMVTVEGSTFDIRMVNGLKEDGRYSDGDPRYWQGDFDSDNAQPLNPIFQEGGHLHHLIATK